MKILKKIVWMAGIVAITCIVIMLICNHIVTSNAKGKVFSDIDSIKYNKVGLLLGTTPQARIGRITNFFFVYRIDAAEQLYKAGKIEKILISGDEHSLDGINEPECMRDSLVARGVPANAIIMDGKGYRTICSVVNANKVYGLKSFTIISQEFHNERAIYQAEHLGLDVEKIQAYNAKDPKSRRAYLTTIREYFARVKMFWDLLTYKEPDSNDTIRVGTSIPQWAEKLNKIPLPEEMQNDSLNDVYFKYNQIVNGYEVTARWKPLTKMSETGKVLINFHHQKTGKDYHYYSEKYCSYDTYNLTFAEGFKGYQNGDVHYFNYTSPDTFDHFKECNDNSPFGYYTPFQFLDIDFDGEEELLVSEWSQGKAGNNYDVFKFTNYGLKKLDYIPLDRLTNLDIIDLKKKTITIVCVDGIYEDVEFYFSSKERGQRIQHLPNFRSSIAQGFDFSKYNEELNVPFVLDSIREYVKADKEYRETYKVHGNKLIR